MDPLFTFRGELHAPGMAPGRLLFALHILANCSIHLQQFYGCAVHFDECDDHAAAWTVGLDDDLLSLDCGLKIVNLKRDMCDRLYKIRIGCPLPVPLPLDAERIVLVIASGDLEVRQWNLALEGARCGNTNV